MLYIWLVEMDSLKLWLNYLNIWITRRKSAFEIIAVKKLLSISPWISQFKTKNLDIINVFSINISNAALLKKLVNLEDSEGNSALVIAARNKDENLLFEIISMGGNVNQSTNNNSKTVKEIILEELPEFEFPEFCLTAVDDDLERPFWRLLEAGNEIDFLRAASEAEEEINWNSTNGAKTMLQFACGKEKLRMVQCLLDLGADPNLVGTYEKPPSFYCGSMEMS